MRLLVVHLLAPLIRAVVATSIVILLSVVLAPSRSRAIRTVEHGRAALPAADAPCCELARHDASDERSLPPDAPAERESDPSSDGEDGEDEGSDEAADGDVPALPGQRPWPSAPDSQSLQRRLHGGTRDTLRTRLGEAPEAPPPRA